jgi:radical SAM superfamily enzyme YgiQ (UPF0313 family)
MPKLLIVQAATYRSETDRRPMRIKKRRLVGLIMPYLAALAPQDWHITLHDDAIAEPPYGEHFDVVAITVRTVTSLRAYEIAARFRATGATVVMGGPHATFYSAEMAEHADAVCVGEGEEVFATMLGDAAAGRLKPLYRRDGVADLAGLPKPRWDLLDMNNYVFYRPFVIQQSRGCPYTCDFCAERRLNGDYGFRDRPAGEIVEDIKLCGSKHIFFAASQFVGHKGRTMELLEKLVPLKIHWSALFSPRFGLDATFLDLAKRSGLLHVNMGIESISQGALKTMHKDFNHVETYKEMIRNLNARNISYSFNFVIGADEDTPDVFDETLKFLDEMKVPAAYFNVISPLRGTPLYDRAKQDGRIIDEPNMERWAGVKCHMQPRNLSADALIAGVKSMQKRFYAWPKLLGRLRFPPRSYADFANWEVCLSQRAVADSDIMNEFSEF